jgi:hypothetical protein
MDLAYDHIQENAYPQDREESNETPKPDQQEPSLNSDLQDAYKAISSSAWGVKIGGFLGNVMKQVRLLHLTAELACLLITCLERVCVRSSSKRAC